MNEINYKYKINEIINNKYGKFLIKNRFIKKYKAKKNGKEYFNNKKYYEYQCLNCNVINTKTESLFEKSGCPVCTNQSIVKGINDISTTDAWMLEYFSDKKDGEKYSKGCGKKILMKCPFCNKERMYSISKLYSKKYLPCICSDKTPLSEKIMFNLLKQLNTDFIFQFIPTWSNNKRYDFYIPSLNMIIETHGGQHYKECGLTRRSLHEEQENDFYKKELALKNGIENYITIDCSEHNFEFIKKSIMESEIKKYFALNNINWKIVEKESLKNIIKEICTYYEEVKDEKTLKDISEEYNLTISTIRFYLKKGRKFGWCNFETRNENCKKTFYEVCEFYNNNKNIRLTEISEIFNLDLSTICSYIKEGGILGLCDYDPTLIKITASNKKKVLVVELNEIFDSTSECARILSLRFNKNFSPACISAICRNKRKTHFGFHFKYIDKDNGEING